jgi:opacity protein-like surface antigen
MRASLPVFLVGLLAACAAQAQLPDPSATPPAPDARSTFKSLRLNPSPADGFYMRNEAELPEHLLPDWRADPRFVIGANLNRYLALQAGYVERFDRGYHKIDDNDPTDRAGALGIHGFNTYAAGKVSLPVTGRLSAYGMLGIAESVRRGSDRVPGQNVDAGLYAKAGVEYRPTKDTALTGTFQNFGHTASRWSGNANGLNLNLKGKF